MSAHTPGPWSRDKYGTLVDSKGEAVNLRNVSIACSGSHVEEAEANTNLIAAAPELLSACQRLLAEVCWDAMRADICTKQACDDIALAESAIAKAIGAKP